MQFLSSQSSVVSTFISGSRQEEFALRCPSRVSTTATSSNYNTTTTRGNVSCPAYFRWIHTVKPFAYSTTAGPTAAPSPSADDYYGGY
ncbi:unnamed protein product [Linum trigynum]|uniref:Uncharacterized protein n=1 Tax=Linum trigynum TaxID=586398 RepID=A0AAV2CEN9_9ROSI